MARVTTIFAMSLAAATALASGSSNSLGGSVSLEENESGLAGLRQSSTGSMLDIDAVVGRSPFQQQQQQPGGTSTANIAVSITPAPTTLLNNRQLPAPLPAPGGGGGRQPLPNPDTGSAASALASLSAQSSSDVAKASTEGFASGSSVAAAQASSQIASISASLAASLSSAIASITATATPGQQAPITLTVTQTVTGTAAPAQQPPATVTQTQTQTQTETESASATVVVTSIVATASMNAAQPTKPDLLPAAPTTSNGLVSDPTKDPNLVDLTVSQLAAVIIGTIIGTALAAVLLTLFLTRFAQRRKSGGGRVYENEQDDSGSQAALRPTYAADEKGGAGPTEQHPAVRTKSHRSNPSESSQRISVFDERPPAGAETAGFGFGPFNWSNVRSSIFGSKSTSPSQSRPPSGQVEFRTAHKRTISNGSKPRLIRLGSRDDRLTPVTEKSHESQAAARSQQQPGGLVPLSGPPSRQMSTSPLNLNPPNAPFRNPSGDAVSWGSWGVAPPDPGPKDHMEVLLKQPPRHQHTPSSSSSGSSKIMDANQLQAAMAADGTIDPPPSTRQPGKHERRPSSGTLGVMGSNPNAGSSSRLDGPPDMPYPLPSFAPYEQRQKQQQQPPQGSYWSPTVTTSGTSGTDTESPVSSIGALKAFPHPPANVRRSVHGRVQSTSSSRYSAYTNGGGGSGLDRHLSQQSVDSSHRRSASVNSFLLTSNTIHTNGATFSLFPAPAHSSTETPPPPMPTRSLSNASAAAGRRQPAVPRAISAVAPPMPPLALGGPPSPPALPRGRGVRSSRPRGSDMV